MSSLWRVSRCVYRAGDGSDATGEGAVAIFALACAAHRGESYPTESPILLNRTRRSLISSLPDGKKSTTAGRQRTRTPTIWTKKRPSKPCKARSSLALARAVT